MIEQGLTLTVIGMATVFIFLILLVFAMMLLSYITRRFFKEEEAEGGKSKAVLTEGPSGFQGQEIAAAIAAAAAYSKQ